MGTLQFLEQPALEEKWKTMLPHKDEGKKLFQQGKYEEALKSYEKGIEIHPTHKTLHSNRALCLVKLNDAKLALEACQNLLKLDPSHPKGHYHRACAYIILSEEITEKTSVHLDKKKSHISRAISEFRTVIK